MPGSRLPAFVSGSAGCEAREAHSGLALVGGGREDPATGRQLCRTDLAWGRAKKKGRTRIKLAAGVGGGEVLVPGAAFCPPRLDGRLGPGRSAGGNE